MEQPRIIPARGDIAPPFNALASKNESFSLPRAGGKRIMLCFFADLKGSNGFGRTLIESWLQHASLFDSKESFFVGITYNEEDLSDPLTLSLPEGMIVVSDKSAEIARIYGIAAITSENSLRHYHGHFILENNLTIADTIVISPDDPSIEKVVEAWKRLPALPSPLPARLDQAPVLIIPNVFEPALCKALIEGYRKNGGTPSGYMKEVNGRTIVAVDPNHKVRSDWLIEDRDIQQAAQIRISRRIAPHIAKCFQFHVTRIERYIVACYNGAEKGHFRAHRDNTTKGTAHRRFAVTINLNADEYEGGDLTFPEFGRSTYRAPTGGAVVFSCSLMHQAMPVVKGERFCFLPFLYDEAAAKIREENSKYLGDGLKPYRA